MHEQHSHQIQTDMQSLLYRRLIQREGPGRVADMAELLDVVPSTVTRQATGNIPVHLQTVWALLQVDPEGGAMALDIVGHYMGAAWRPARGAEPSILDAVSAVSRAQAESSESTALACAALADGVVTPDELVALERRWAQEDHRREEMRQLMRAKCQDTSRKVVSL